MPCIKQETNVVKNDIEKRTKGLNDYMGEAKLKLFTQTDQFTCLADFEIKSIWPKFKVSGQSSKYLAKVQSSWPKWNVNLFFSLFIKKQQAIKSPQTTGRYWSLS